MSFDLDVRLEVAAFALLMERKLRENDHKRHWRYCTLNYLSRRLTQERRELSQAIAKDLDASAIADECADVANFAMMIADKFQKLSLIERTS